MKKWFLIAAVLIMVLVAATGCNSEENETLSILNYDIYIDKGLLKEFEEDLHLHIHLENNILFPKSLEIEEELVTA